MFQSTSSEEDVVSSILALRCRQLSSCFNPRPPKRTLCLDTGCHYTLLIRFNPRPPKRTLCRGLLRDRPQDCSFNPRPPKRTLCLLRAASVLLNSLFQSTSSEEDVVSTSIFAHPLPVSSFNPRPPKRTLCRV